MRVDVRVRIDQHEGVEGLEESRAQERADMVARLSEVAESKPSCSNRSPRQAAAARIERRRTGQAVSGGSAAANAAILAGRRGLVSSRSTKTPSTRARRMTPFSSRSANS